MTARDTTMGKCKPVPRCRRERGATLIFVALSLALLLGVCAMAIDLAWLYLADLQAQRAADAAALAGAKTFVESNYTTAAAPGAGFFSPYIADAVAQDLAKNVALAVAGQNVVAGIQLTGSNVSASVNDARATPMAPQITVTVGPIAVPTFFGKSFGIRTVNISASATAEAYNPSGSSSLAISTAGVKPWLLPNLDPVSLHLSMNCNYASPPPFLDKNSKQVCNPGYLIDLPPGVVGEGITLTQGDPSAPTAGQFYVISDYPTATTVAPACAASDSYSQAIAGSNTSRFTCGGTVAVSINKLTGVGNSVLTQNATQCLIHASGAGLNQGQDSVPLNFNIFGQSFALFPFAATAGSSNPIPGASGKNVNRSDSLVTVPLYDGSQLCSGNGCVGTKNVTIIGFLQLFITDYVAGTSSTQSQLHATVFNVAGCSGGSGPLVAPGGSMLPVRLIQ
jgi:Flp pilus assembly protein TadG